jgi:trehalose 6-phosphate phosphatase
VIEETVARLRADAPAGGLVEAKGLAVTVHWRTAPELEAWATSAVAAEVERTGLVAHPGRRSLELRPPLTVDKGTVVRGLLEGSTAATYFGDDLGDLPAFATLADLADTRGLAALSVAVADDESPAAVLDAADLVLSGPAEAIDALAWLAGPPIGD